MISLVTLIVGLLIGWSYRDLKDRIDLLTEAPKEKPKTGPTMGSYHHIDEVNPRVAERPKGRVITPKTPQRVEWDAQQQLEEEGRKIKVVPR